MKKILCALLALTMSVSFSLALIGCDSENENPTTTENNKPTETTEYTDPPSAEDAYSEGLTFTSNGDGTCYVSDAEACLDKHVVIPSKSPAGDTVTAIGDEVFCDRIDLLSVTFPETLTTIGDFAFYSCVNLSSVTIPEKVTDIGEEAFYFCNKLKEVINHSALVLEIGEVSNGALAGYAFEVHNGESKIVNIDGYLFYSINGTNYLINYIGTETELRLPESFNGGSYEIHTAAFHQTSKITSVVIPDAVTFIAREAFSFCSELRHLTIGKNVTTIGEDAFNGCNSLITVTLPESVIDIREDAFGNCDKLVEVINHSALDIVKGETTHGAVAENALEVHTGESKLENQDGYLFYTVEGSHYMVAYVGVETDLVLPESFHGETYEINNFACDSHQGITSIVIGKGVSHIGSFAFASCNNLKTAIIQDGVPSADSFVFSSCEKLTHLSIGKDLEFLGHSLPSGCPSLVSITVDEQNPYVKAIDNVLYSKDGTTLYIYTAKKQDTAFTVPDTVTYIDASAFRAANNLTTIVLNDTIPYIELYAFGDCEKLTSVVFGKGLTEIALAAFNGCDALTTVYYTGSEEEFANIDISSLNDAIIEAEKIYNYLPEN